MGKHERDWAEKVEKSITDGLNGIKQDDSIQLIVDSIKKQISEKIIKAIWVGGKDYKNPGDIHVYTPNDIIKIEQKISRAKSIGTIKNLSSELFEKKISNEIKGYQKFDDELGLKSQRYQIVEEITGTKIETDKQYKSLLRELKKSNKNIIKKISQLTSPGQKQYVEYSSEKLKNHLNEVNELTSNILYINNKSEQEVLYCVVRNFESLKQTVDFFDFTNIDRKVTKIIPKGKSIKFCNYDGKDIIRFSVTWKNICQGGSTPCFNVFIGNAFKG